MRRDKRGKGGTNTDEERKALLNKQADEIEERKRADKVEAQKIKAKERHKRSKKSGYGLLLRSKLKMLHEYRTSQSSRG